MLKTMSCGVVILNERGELFVAHATGSSHWDIPKGMADGAETPIDTALRETFEETGLRLNPEALTDLGVFAYRPDKTLHLFFCAVVAADVDLEACRCTSFFEHPRSGARLPEVDAYKWISFDEVPGHCAKNMARLLTAHFNLFKAG